MEVARGGGLAHPVDELGAGEEPDVRQTQHLLQEQLIAQPVLGSGEPVGEAVQGEGGAVGGVVGEKKLQRTNNHTSTFYILNRSKS